VGARAGIFSAVVASIEQDGKRMEKEKARARAGGRGGDERRTLEGMQPTFRHVPPSAPRFSTHTCLAACAHTIFIKSGSAPAPSLSPSHTAFVREETAWHPVYTNNNILPQDKARKKKPEKESTVFSPSWAALMAATYPPGPPPMMATSYSAPLDMNRTAAHPAAWVQRRACACARKEIRDGRLVFRAHLVHPCARGCAPCARLGCRCEASANRAHARTTEPGAAPAVRRTVRCTRDSRTVHMSGSGVRPRVRNSGVRSRPWLVATWLSAPMSAGADSHAGGTARRHPQAPGTARGAPAHTLTRGWAPPATLNRAKVSIVMSAAVGRIDRVKISGLLKLFVPVHTLTPSRELVSFVFQSTHTVQGTEAHCRRRSESITNLTERDRERELY
jgi:hypothetical protein